MKKAFLLFLILLTPTASHAQTAPVTAYEGCTIAWSFTSVPELKSFAFSIDGVTGSTTIPKDARSIACDATILKGKPFKQYTLKLIAVANPPAIDSPPATLLIDYKARPVLKAPTSFTVQ